MKIELTVKKEFEVTHLNVNAGVRYWEDATVNGIEDTDGLLIPCRINERWMPLIDLETGIITNWKKGVKAEIQYKICDDGIYILLDKDSNVVKEIEGYVPNILDLHEDGFGDCIIINVDENGLIEDFKCDLTYFTNEDED